MSIAKAFRTANAKKEDRGWDKIYVAVDWHDTICESTYTDGVAYGFYPKAIECLRMMSGNPQISLILYTSSYISVSEDFMRFCRHEYDINFEFFNCNHDVANTSYGDFGKKFYYDILVDDKAGFDPDEDWDILAWHVNFFMGQDDET